MNRAEKQTVLPPDYRGIKVDSFNEKIQLWISNHDRCSRWTSSALNAASKSQSFRFSRQETARSTVPTVCAPAVAAARWVAQCHAVLARCSMWTRLALNVVHTSASSRSSRPAIARFIASNAINHAAPATRTKTSKAKNPPPPAEDFCIKKPPAGAWAVRAFRRRGGPVRSSPDCTEVCGLLPQADAPHTP